MAITKVPGLIRPHSSKLNALSRLLDIAIIVITLWATSSIYHLEWDQYFLPWLLISIIAYVFFAEISEVYHQGRGGRIGEESIAIVMAWVGVIFVFIAVDNFFTIIEEVVQRNFWTWIFFVPVEIVSWHIIIRVFVDMIRRQGRNTRRVAIVGGNELGVKLKQIFMQETWMGMKFVGFYDDRQKDQDFRVTIDINDIRGNIDNLITAAKQDDIDIVYVVLPLRAEQRIKDIFSKLSDTTVSLYFVPDFFVFDLLRSRWTNIQGITVVSIYDSPFYGIDGMAKRILDIVVASIILCMIALPMLIIAIGVKLTSPGPVIFKQKRYGFRGEKIEVWKFRSMAVLENDDSVKQATKNDPRVTAFGAFLRKTSLDELPQFINVLQGKMSVVGPRPHAISHNEHYRKIVQGYMLRHKVKPGITGLAQIKGYRGETDTLDKMEGRVAMDLEYISTWSLFLDLKIIFLTFFNGFINKNAY